MSAFIMSNHTDAVLAVADLESLPSSLELDTETAEVNDPYMLSNHVTETINFVNFALLCTTTAMFGIVANILNMMVFRRLGFNDTVNISLFTLSLADLASLTTLLWAGTCFNTIWHYFDVPFYPRDVVYLTGCLPRLYFTRVDGWITSLVAIERCICVLKPMQVKMIVTKNRVVAAQFLFFIGAFFTMVPIYYSTRMGWRLSANNRTILRIYYIDDNHKYDRISHAMGMLASFSAFVIVTSCTFILAFSLVKQSRWRAQMASSQQREGDTGEGSGDKKSKADMSTRDRQALKTVTLIAGMFVVCLLPNAFNVIAMGLFPEYNKDRDYNNIYMVVWSFAQFTEAISSSSNIFVYYYTSTKFKHTLLKILKRNPDGSKDLTSSSGGNSSSSDCYNKHRDLSTSTTVRKI